MMTSLEAEISLSRIISGVVRCKVKDIHGNKTFYLIKNNTRYHKYISYELYKDFYQEAIEFGLYDDDEYQNFLLDNNIWLPEKEARVKSLQEDIEELKVRMFSSLFNTQTMNTARKVLILAKEDLNKLYYQKTAYDYLSAAGFAEMEKNKFLIGMSLYRKEKTVMNESSYWRFPNYILSQIINIYKQTRLPEKDFRWLARNEPWHSYWLAKKTENSLLSIPAVDMNEEQRALIIWSTVYDNVAEHPEQPSQRVITDDDLLDGWFIVQRRKREKELNISEAEQLISNDKIKNSAEIFIPAFSAEEAQRISGLNDMQGDLTKRQRFNYIEKHGEVSEANLPDVRMDLKQQYNKLYVDKVTGN